MDEKLREKFEAWISPSGSWPRSIERHADGYKNIGTQNAWEAWQACAAALSQPAAQGDSSHPAGGECGGVTQPGLAGEELALFRATLEGFADCGETDTDYSTLVDWALRGFLECTNFRPTAAAHRMLASNTPTDQKGNAA